MECQDREVMLISLIQCSLTILLVVKLRAFIGKTNNVSFDTFIDLIRTSYTFLAPYSSLQDIMHR